jgi:hypothetical protein
MFKHINLRKAECRSACLLVSNRNHCVFLFLLPLAGSDCGLFGGRFKVFFILSSVCSRYHIVRHVVVVVLCYVFFDELNPVSIFFKVGTLFVEKVDQVVELFLLCFLLQCASIRDCCSKIKGD